MILYFKWPSGRDPGWQEEEEWRALIVPLLDGGDARSLTLEAVRIEGGWSIWLVLSDSHSGSRLPEGGGELEYTFTVVRAYLKNEHPLAQQIVAALQGAGKPVSLGPVPPPTTEA